MFFHSLPDRSGNDLFCPKTSRFSGPSFISGERRERRSGTPDRALNGSCAPKSSETRGTLRCRSQGSHQMHLESLGCSGSSGRCSAPHHTFGGQATWVEYGLNRFGDTHLDFSSLTVTILYTTICPSTACIIDRSQKRRTFSGEPY